VARSQLNRLVWNKDILLTKEEAEKPKLFRTLPSIFQSVLQEPVLQQGTASVVPECQGHMRGLNPWGIAVAMPQSFLKHAPERRGRKVVKANGLIINGCIDGRQFRLVLMNNRTFPSIPAPVVLPRFQPRL
jgi:hypothetical protein